MSKALAGFFGLWHEMRRGSHRGVHELWCGGWYVYLVNLRVGPHGEASPYRKLLPAIKPSSGSDASMLDALGLDARTPPGSASRRTGTARQPCGAAPARTSTATE